MDIAEAAMACDPLTMSVQARGAVDQVMRRHCELRGWDLRALSVRSNHVHVVLADPSIRPEPMVKQLKEWGTRTLRAGGWAAPSRRVWADHASTIYLFEPGSMEEKVHYVMRMQDEPPPGHGRRR